MRELALVVLSCCGEDWLMVQPPTAAARVAATAALAISFMGVVSPYAARVWHNALQRKRDLAGQRSACHRRARPEITITMSSMYWKAATLSLSTIRRAREEPEIRPLMTMSPGSAPNWRKVSALLM